MNRFNTTATLATGLAAVLLSLTATAADFSAAAVRFAPGLEDVVKSRYGAAEVPVLRKQIIDAVSAALIDAGTRCNLGLEVIIERVAPSHPTLQQQLANPALDPTRTGFLDGGAALAGHLRGADGHELATVKYDHFVDNDLRFTAASKDPWSDTEVAIGEFTTRLLTACERQSSHQPAH